jgi:transposase-like protein
VTRQFDKLGSAFLKDDRHGGAEEGYPADFKANVALEVIRGELTMAQLVWKHCMRQTMVSAWRKQAIEENDGGVFRQSRGQSSC